MVPVRLLGSFQIGDTATVPPKGLQPLAAYFFHFPDAPHRREKLLALFWPELDEKRARAALSTACWRLRLLITHAASPMPSKACLMALQNAIFLQSCGAFSVDSHNFRCLAKGVISAPPAHASASRLDELKSAYSGPFLDGEDAPWVIVEREDLQVLFLQAMRSLMRAFVFQERFSHAIECARRALSMDPFDEAVQHALLILYILNSQRGEAIRSFNRWTLQLRDELGILPEPRLRTY